MTKVKICGLFREIDIDYINKAKPDYAGFIINFPKSHRSIDINEAKNLIKKLDKNIKSVCVFVNMPIDYVMQFNNICDIIQLHGQEDNEYIEKLRKESKNKEIWQAFKIRDNNDIKKAQRSNADIILLDNGYGTGEQFNWDIIKDMKRDFILAGGINIENVQKAIKEFKPYALDISSSVETQKLKDFEKIDAIIKKVKSEE